MNGTATAGQVGWVLLVSAGLIVVSLSGAF
jgi:hypothetical protein